MVPTILVINAGFSSLKFAAFEINRKDEMPPRLGWRQEKTPLASAKKEWEP
jgi:acetate kinase